jgi:sugar (pentulose or hexulose) kinase
LRAGRERIEKRSRQPITSLRIAGGGSQSDAAMQIAADVFALPAVRPHVYETSDLGAAIALSVGLGAHPNFDAAVRAMTRDGRVFTPDPEARALYDALYTRVYKRMYARLKPLYEEIRTITGYPD